MKKENSVNEKTRHGHILNVRWTLVFYDIAIFLLSAFVLLFLYDRLPVSDLVIHVVLGGVCIFAARFAMNIYRLIWRYGGIQAYIKLLMSDALAFGAYFLLQRFLPINGISFVRLLSLVCVNLLFALAMRMAYRYAYQIYNKNTRIGAFFRVLMRVFGGMEAKDIEPVGGEEKNKIKVAIIGAGRVGVVLADELMSNRHSSYTPCCFIDANPEKSGRQIFGLPVLSNENVSYDELNRYGVQEVVFALPQLTAERKKELFDLYKGLGFKIKVYDYPVMQAAGNARRSLREFDIEELLFRKPVDFADERTSSYYKDKVILITGGGGSIGSELCRQIAKMGPKKLVILDVYENGAYDVQQELRIAYGGKLNVQVEILSVCDKKGLDKVFEAHRPNIVLNAAAHKHVPLMEHNCCEAVKNNVFGTLNTVEVSEKYGVERFIMVSTDKAVNPTNVMGATKRMCEMIVLSRCRSGCKTVYSATRFGNVLGSAGSVIPLFKRQIKNGGPVTITDKRIIRYFMTIPEASQLVLQSGAMAKNGELFVLDMGKPVKILDLAENMVRLAGFIPYKDIDIVETGLREGEKLYEELLIKNEDLDKTENHMIFIERDNPPTEKEVAAKLDLLRDAVATEDNEIVKAALKKAVPTFKTPEEVNAEASKAEEMKIVNEITATDKAVFVKS